MPEGPSPPDPVARERLVEAARLAALGRLLPSFLHQLSTPLAAIAVRAESLGKAGGEDTPPRSDRAERYLQAIATDTERCQQLLVLMRDFARPPDDGIEPVDLTVVCQGAAQLVLHEAMRRQVEVQLDLADSLPRLHGQGTRLRGAVLALIVNAIDASSPGDRVTVKTSAPAGGVAVAVADEGEGIADTARARLFEPFFSTRPRGLGIGLMACRVVAEAHGGSVEVETSPGRGSRFTLSLPAAGPEAGAPEGHGVHRA